MTVLDAIKTIATKYPLNKDTFNRILLDRGLSGSSEYLGKKKEFELAAADVYKHLVTAPDLFEGGVKISITEKIQLTKIANAIYRKHGELTIGAITVPRGRASSNW